MFRLVTVSNKNISNWISAGKIVLFYFDIFFVYFIQHGLFVDNIFHTTTAATGYNKYHPVEDPLMHLKYKNSTNKAAVFNRLTGNKLYIKIIILYCYTPLTVGVT